MLPALIGRSIAWHDSLQCTYLVALAAVHGKRQNIVTDLILRILGLEVGLMAVCRIALRVLCGKPSPFPTGALLVFKLYT